jgi:hypothetical protein
MQEIVYSLARSTKTQVETNRYVLRSKRDQATISYQTESLKSLYEFARAHDAMVQGFDFSLLDQDRRVLVRAGFNRDGKLSYHGGSKEFFLKEFVETVAQTVKSRTDVLNGRAPLKFRNTPEGPPERAGADHRFQTATVCRYFAQTRFESEAVGGMVPCLEVEHSSGRVVGDLRRR